MWKHFVEVCKNAFSLVIPIFIYLLFFFFLGGGGGVGVKKSTNLFAGFRIHFFLKIGTFEIAKKPL